VEALSEAESLELSPEEELPPQAVKVDNNRLTLSKAAREDFQL
jgi:hypothetical protein